MFPALLKKHESAYSLFSAPKWITEQTTQTFIGKELI